MEKSNLNKELCLERDARRCRHCGSVEDIEARQLIKRGGRLAWQLSNLITLCNECHQKSVDSLKNKDSNMFGVMLCGGRSTRLFPITRAHNKHSLPIGIVPMCLYPLNTLREFGCYRVLVVVDREGGEVIQKILGSGKEFGMDISYKIQEGAGGISEALYLAKNLVKRDDKIVCILGDNIFDNDGIQTLDFNMGENKACVYIRNVENPEAYGVAEIRDGKVIRIVEKPKEFVSNKAVVGLYIYTNDVFDVIESTEPSNRGELEISTVNHFFSKTGDLTYRMVNGYWSDAGGSIERYAESCLYGAKQANVSAEDIDIFKSAVFDDK